MNFTRLPYLVLIALFLFSPRGHTAELPTVDCVPFASGYVSPTEMISFRDGAEAFLVTDQVGTITFLDEEGGEPGSLFLDLRDRLVDVRENFDERGLLGLALHPEFADNGKFYVYYSAPLREEGPEKFDHTSRISEFTCDPEQGVADPESERILLEIDQPQFNHDGGNILFGADGFLYIGVGDGGGANDVGLGHVEGGNGQALDLLLGKILRIDVDSGDPYGIPADNPLVGKEGRDEIFAWGLRNPWGMTLDEEGGNRVIAADVGQNRFEEVNVIRGGENYGWPRYEGLYPFDPEDPNAAVEGAPPAEGSTGEFAAPELVYPHASPYGDSPYFGVSITGGHVYRGKAIPGLEGVYVFGDWISSWGSKTGSLFAGIPNSEGAWERAVLPGSASPVEGPTFVVGFAEDREKELYVLTNNSRGPTGKSGSIWKIVAGE